jgi:hypothetical protein
LGRRIDSMTAVPRSRLACRVYVAVRETSHPRPIARSCLGAATSLRSFLSHLRPATSSPKNTSVASASCSERRKFPAPRRIATPEGAPLQDVGRRLERHPFSGARFVVSGVDAAAAISCPRPMFATGSGASGRLGTWGPDPVDLKAMAQATQLDMAIAYRNVVRILGGLGGARCGGGGRSAQRVAKTACSSFPTAHPKVAVTQKLERHHTADHRTSATSRSVTRTHHEKLPAVGEPPPMAEAVREVFNKPYSFLHTTLSRQA